MLKFPNKNIDNNSIWQNSLDINVISASAYIDKFCNFTVGWGTRRYLPPVYSATIVTQPTLLKICRFIFELTFSKDNLEVTVSTTQFMYLLLFYNLAINSRKCFSMFLIIVITITHPEIPFAMAYADKYITKLVRHVGTPFRAIWDIYGKTYIVATLFFCQ